MIHLPEAFEEIIYDVPKRVPLLRHVDPDSILVLVHRMSSRKQGQNAGLRHARQGKVFAPVFPDVRYQDRDIRYVISFNPGICSGFFKDCNDPMEVVMHELWHIGTKCDGKLRRMRHGKQFNEIVKDLTETYYRNGGAPVPEIGRSNKITTRYWKNRQSPSIAYVRRGLLQNLSRELAKISWQEEWGDDHIMEKNRVMSSLLPKSHVYVCPNDHQLETHVKFRKIRSCSECSHRFDRRFILKPLV